MEYFWCYDYNVLYGVWVGFGDKINSLGIVFVVCSVECVDEIYDCVF